MIESLQDLPESVQTALDSFVTDAQSALGENLRSVILYGSAAEGRLRASSDVNLILVLTNFDISKIDALRESLCVAYAAIRLNVMFLLEAEIAGASEAFAVKFNDVLSRRRVLFGTDAFSGLVISRAATLGRLEQVLTNLILRMRERYALVSLREEQLTTVIADLTGPIRAAAANLLNLQGESAASPKEALQRLAAKYPGRDWAPALASMSAAREGRFLKAGEAPRTLIELLELVALFQSTVRAMRSSNAS